MKVYIYDAYICTQVYVHNIYKHLSKLNKNY